MQVKYFQFKFSIPILSQKALCDKNNSNKFKYSVEICNNRDNANNIIEPGIFLVLTLIYCIDFLIQ